MDKCPKHAPQALARTLEDDHTVVLCAEGSQAVVLNPTASVVWELCDGSRSVEDIVAWIHENSPESTKERVFQDVESLVKELAEQQLLIFDIHHPHDCSS